MSPHPSRPPEPGRFVRRLVAAVELRVAPERAEFVAGDLEEELRRRWALGRVGACWWLLRQILGLAMRGMLSWRAQSVRSAASVRHRVGDEVGHLGSWRVARLLDHLRRDVALGLRRLGRSPAATTVVVLTLAIGIGLNVAVFMLADTLLLRPLPYAEPSRLLSIETNMGGVDWFGSSEPELFDLEALGELDTVAGWSSRFLTLGEGAEGRRLLAVEATGNLLELLGVPPLLGRYPDPEEDVPGADPVAVISYALWQSRLGGAPEVIGRTLRLDGRPTKIIGVMPARFRFPTLAVEAWMPLRLDRNDPWERNNHYLDVVARVRDGVALEEASAALDLLSTRSEQLHPEFYGDGGLQTRARRLQTAATERERLPLAFLLAAVGLLLLLACANVANVQLGRGAARAREVSVARALGASRGRLIGELMVESSLLSLAGAALALVVAKGAEASLPRVLPEDVLRFGAPTLDLRVLAFALAIALVTTLLFGLWPAFQNIRVGGGGAPDVSQAQLSRHGRPSQAVRSGLVVVQVALAVVLLVGCGLLVRSLQHVLAVDAGFEIDRVLAITSLPPADILAEPEEIVGYYRQVEQTLESLPGVVSAGALARLPFSPGGNNWSILIEGEPARTVAEAPSALVQQVTPGAFEALGIERIAGRTFDSNDRAGSLPVVVVNEAFAKTHWPGENPLGKRMKAFMEDLPWLTVVGVVATIRDFDLREEGRPQWYLPHAQAYETAYFSPRVLSLVVRTQSPDPLDVLPAAQDRLREVDDRVIHIDPAPLAAAQAGSVGLTRLLAQWLALFSGVAIALAAVGLYGVFSFLVAIRSFEIGLRMALGATPRRVLRSVLREGLWLCLLGLGLGLGLALAVSRAVRGLFFGVSIADPTVLAVTLSVLALAASVALLAPALRASRTGLATVLRGG